MKTKLSIFSGILLTVFSWAAVCQAGKVVVVPLSDTGSSDKQMLYNNEGRVGGAEVYYDKTTGFVGIGTQTPTDTLQVNGTVNATAFTLNGNPICQAAEQPSPVLSDLIIPGSLAVGSGASAPMSFGFNTLIMMDDAMRILFEDTSASVGFPTNDWRITLNDLDNAVSPKSYFAIDDITAGTRPFTIEAAAPDNSLFIQNNTGNVGIGTNQPNSSLHVNGYIQLSLTDGTPPAVDCDEATEYGRMIIDSGAGLLYLCADIGWVAK